jgi:hypothetical protein
MKRIPMPWTTVTTKSQTPTTKFYPATPWLPAESVNRARGTFELISADANLSVTFGYQTANVENSPDAQVTIGSAKTSDGMSYGTLTDISSNTNGKHLVRFGYDLTNTSAALAVSGRVGGFVDISAEV